MSFWEETKKQKQKKNYIYKRYENSNFSQTARVIPNNNEIKVSLKSSSNLFVYIISSIDLVGRVVFYNCIKRLTLKK